MSPLITNSDGLLEIHVSDFIVPSEQSFKMWGLWPFFLFGCAGSLSLPEGHFLVVVHRVLIAGASLVEEHGL